MSEKKGLLVLSMVVSLVSLLDHIFYSYLYLPLVASSLAIISLVQNKGRQKVWSIAALAVAVVTYAQRLFLIKCKVPPSY
ncbi:hypothetical protein [Streptococcus pyogenes]|uniref:hypothetical protein n=1 Tax=Streptococcus pyogenes TaxID=1314 RepID=UPI0010E76525|nr:hypothetical membrane spanning protein [Streptococcus pyogenes]VHF28450.1 Uncharacterised protein [Streptococcus pyogenes]VHI46279.1 Uncharacterised protein [Streptococcus pyogenes]VHM31684.1 Uncharacterised protein [Streptococcus pyogenes]